MNMDFRNDDDIVSTFIEETLEHLVEIESGMLFLEDQKGTINAELVHTMFRAAHTVKAGANLLQAYKIETLSHALENILELLRQEKLTLNNEIIITFLAGIDKIRELINHFENSNDADITLLTQKLSSFQ